MAIGVESYDENSVGRRVNVRLPKKEANSDDHMDARWHMGKKDKVKWDWRWDGDRNWKGRMAVYTKHKVIRDIKTQLKRVGRLSAFENSCFGHLLRFDSNAYTCAMLLVPLLGREVYVHNRSEYERWFRIGTHMLRFSATEFCMLTGLRFGTSTFRPDAPHLKAAPDGVYSRWYQGRPVSAEQLWKDFRGGQFAERPDDALRVAHVLIVTLYLYGVDLRDDVEHWKWVLVDDLVAWDMFPWGKFVFQRLCHYIEHIKHAITPSRRLHMYGFPIALQLWAYECIPALGRRCARRLSSDTPRGAGWRCPRKRNIDISILEITECRQIEPDDMERGMSYMADIDMDITDGVQYVHPENPVGKASGACKKRTSSKTASNRPNKANKKADANADDLCTNAAQSTEGQSCDHMTPPASPILPANVPTSKDQRVQPKLKTVIKPMDSKISAVPGDDHLVNINGYIVKIAYAPVLEAIFAKHGDIMSNCVCKSTFIRASLLEALCNIVQRLQHVDFEVLISDLEVIEKEVSDLKASNIEVSWLHEQLAKLRKIAEKFFQLRKKKVKSGIVSNEAAKEMKRRHAELVLAQERFKEAENRVNAIRLIGRKIDEDMLEYESEAYFWRRRLDDVI